MTRYEVGFMNKCAEYGLMTEQAIGLMRKSAFVPPPPPPPPDASAAPAPAATTAATVRPAAAVPANVVRERLRRSMNMPKRTVAPLALTR